MKGDFSRWPPYKKESNFNGVLYQQGRVFSDWDGTTQTRIVNDWQVTTASDVIGRGVAAVPSDDNLGFKITSGEANNDGTIILSVKSGRIWIDGMLIYLDNGKNKIISTPLGIPFQKLPLPNITEGTRYAVILEAWQDSLNGFQMPKDLIEPALGGPDTTEMLYTSFAFRFFRLDDSDICSNIYDRVKDRTDGGKLTVSLKSNPPTAGDCPIDENYGYTGHTHNLYMVSIANTNDGVAKFKWSQFNGGLVGRGDFIAGPPTKIKITHSLQPILRSGLTGFYLEIVKYDPALKYWNVVYGANATLNSNNEIVLASSPVFSTMSPNAGDEIFFRLWDGIEKISDFTSNTPPAMLNDGITLKFDTPVGSNYLPGDFWIFSVRAAGLGNSPTLLNAEVPHGVRYHRAPLAILTWDNSGTISSIEDCRVPFPPLVRHEEGCCSLTVGDGKLTHGDFDSLEQAILSIGNAGGEICLLPGWHQTNATIKNKWNIIIRGCGNRATLINNSSNKPIISIIDSKRVVIENVKFNVSGSAPIFMKGTNNEDLNEIRIANNYIESAQDGIIVENGDNIIIEDNIILIGDNPVEATGIGINLGGRNVLISRNRISVADMSLGLGGVLIRSGSRDIEVLHNLINGGTGNGVTIGDYNLSKNMPFLYNILIESNEISNMDLSGIGIPRIPRIPRQISRRIVETGELPRGGIMTLGSPVMGLQICRNHISKCLRKAFDQNMTTESRLWYRGFGGITLSYCENAYIAENKIEHNGIQHTSPICGIFVFIGLDLTIIHNYICDNGPILETSQDMDPGKRGGIVILYAIGRNNPTIAGSRGLGAGDYAAGIHSNIVNQPCGAALVMGAMGKVSVLDNYFSSEFGDKWFTTPESSPFNTGGCVRLFNFGKNISRHLATGYEMRRTSQPRRSVAMEIESSTFAVSVPSVILADTLFNNNQVRLGRFNDSRIAELIFSESDLNFESNQINCLNYVIDIDTVVFAESLRASSNRIRELKSRLSLFSLSTQMNITSNNQCDSCIIAVNMNSSIPVERPAGNQILWRTNDECEELQSKFSSVVKSLGNSYG